MAYVGTQTDTAAQDGTLTACSSGTTLADGSVASSQMVENGTAGTTEQTIKNSAGVNSVVGFNVQSAAGEPGASTWDAGDWVIRHPEVTTGNTNWTWQEAHVCEIRPDGTVAGTVVSATGLGIAMSAGNHSTTVTQGSDYTPAASDSEIYIVYVYDVGGSHGNEQFGVTPNQNIDTPITTSTAVSLTPNPLAQSQTLASPSLAQAHTLTPAALAQAQALDAANLSQAHALTVNALSQAQALDEAGLSQVHALAANALSQAQSVDAPTLDQVHALTAVALSQPQTVDAASLDQTHSLDADAVSQSQTTASPTASQSHVLTAEALSQAVALEAATISVEGVVSLAPDALSQDQALDSPALAQAHTLTPDSLDQEQTLGAVTLVQSHTLTAEKLTQAHTLDEAGLSVVHVLQPDELTHDQAVDRASVGQSHALGCRSISQTVTLEAAEGAFEGAAPDPIGFKFEADQESTVFKSAEKQTKFKASET